LECVNQRESCICAWISHYRTGKSIRIITSNVATTFSITSVLKHTVSIRVHDSGAKFLATSTIKMDAAHRQYLFGFQIFISSRMQHHTLHRLGAGHSRQFTNIMSMSLRCAI
jgi:putative salt-induced outer membrane protein YdiY